MFQIKTLNKISASGLSLLDPAKYTYGDEIENPDAVLRAFGLDARHDLRRQPQGDRPRRCRHQQHSGRRLRQAGHRGL